MSNDLNFEKISVDKNFLSETLREELINLSEKFRNQKLNSNPQIVTKSIVILFFEFYVKTYELESIDVSFCIKSIYPTMLNFFYEKLTMTGDDLNLNIAFLEISKKGLDETNKLIIDNIDYLINRLKNGVH